MELNFDRASKSREIANSNFSKQVEENIKHLRGKLILEIKCARDNASTRIYCELHAMSDKVHEAVCAAVRDELKDLGYHVVFPIEHRLTGESRKYIEVGW